MIAKHRAYYYVQRNEISENEMSRSMRRSKPVE